MPVSFFQHGREDFFRPLTGSWRAVVGEALVQLYEAFFGQHAGYSHCIERDDLRSLVINVLQECPDIDNEAGSDDDKAMSSKDEVSKANEIIRRLRTFGWIEIFDDPGTHREVYRFTRAGKLFSQQMAEYNSPLLRMTQRNVRNTKNSLKAYLESKDAYDLFMALDHSRSVVHDLADDIAEIHERRRQIIAQATHESAISDFVSYMKGKFAPVTAVKMRADNVYQHEREVQQLISAIKNQDADQLGELERGARVFRAARIHEGSIVLQTLDEIVGNLRDAMQYKMAELAAAVSAYTDRTSFLVLQASIISATGGIAALSKALDALSGLKVDAQDIALERLYNRAAPFRIALIDESCIRLRRSFSRAAVQTLQDERQPSREDRRAAFLDQAESTGFALSMRNIRARLDGKIKELNGERTEFLLSEIGVTSYDDLVFLTHAIESVYDEDSALRLECTPLGVRRGNAYLEFDDIAIRVIEQKQQKETDMGVFNA